MSDWESNAADRARQIQSGIDLSYSEVLVPTILRKLPKPGQGHWRRLLDAGCGPGVLAHQLATDGWEVVGVDASEAMIKVASENSEKHDNPRFLRCAFSEIPRVFPNTSFDAVVTNMSLTGVLDLDPVFESLRCVTRGGAILVLADVHPWFWRLYKGHHDLGYRQVTVLSEPFTISLDNEPLPSPTKVVYRSLGALVEPLTRNGFKVADIEEPWPRSEVEAKYPAPWLYPRFLILVAEAV